MSERGCDDGEGRGMAGVSDLSGVAGVMMAGGCGCEGVGEGTTVSPSSGGGILDVDAVGDDFSDSGSF